MAEEAQPVAVEPEGYLEADIDTVIASFEGDTCAAIRALLIANEFLTTELERSRSTVSVGYVRKGPVGQ